MGSHAGVCRVKWSHESCFLVTTEYFKVVYTVQNGYSACNTPLSHRKDLVMEACVIPTAITGRKKRLVLQTCSLTFTILLWHPKHLLLTTCIAASSYGIDFDPTFATFSPKHKNVLSHTVPTLFYVTMFRKLVTAFLFSRSQDFPLWNVWPAAL